MSTTTIITIARCLLFSTALVISGWAIGPLGGLGAWTPPQSGADDADTAAAARSSFTQRLFNWHPVLMSTFLVCAGEAMLAYRSNAPLPLMVVAAAAAPPPPPPPSRPARKAAHATLHTLALAVALLGSTAAWRSHSLAQPPIPHLYSPHSWLGLCAMLMFVAQAAMGARAYLAAWPVERRASFVPWHRLAGLCAFFAALAAVATGVQEKATFAQAFGGAGMRGGAVAGAAAIEVGVLLSGLAVAAAFFAPVGCGGGGSGFVAVAAATEEEGLLPSPRGDRGGGG